MNLLSRLYQRFAHLVRELAKFGSVGAVAFVITMALSNVLHSGLGMGPLSSNAIATVVATTFAYAANRYWTFRHRDRTGLGREYVLFFALNGVGLVITQLFIGFTHYVLGLTGPLPYNASLVVGTGVATLFRFWSYKKWVFLPAEAPLVDPASGLPEAPARTPNGQAAPDPAAAAGTDPQVNGRTLPAHGLGRPIDSRPAEGYAEFTR
ncbi:GtrA family protein [Actinomadura viridis]|uniref:Flippase GtrA n=1 Tax=Actinomadura viridis TaxID=58110 RepID=A0A931DH48_9ACTN|nr:GtrA family protein [Actinomadura viridis]MBG6086633.1 putative flippase GtrA [Actinomadura viridis]